MKRDEVRPFADALADGAITSATGYCRRFPARCLAGATRLATKVDTVPKGLSR